MFNKQYLIAIDGSEESRSVAYYAWKLAGTTGSRVDAIHVVNTESVWNFLSHDRAGFIGSGLYMESREKITESLHSIAEALMVSYSCQIAGTNLENENFIEEGEPVRVIAERAKNYDLVIMGYRNKSTYPGQKRMYERLAEICPVPILVVRNAYREWSKIQVFLANADQDSTCFSDMEDVVSADTGSRQDDVLMVISSQVLNDQDSARRKTQIRSFMDKSEKRGLLIWNNPTQSPATISITTKLAS